MVVLSQSWQREWGEISATSISLSVTWDRRRFSEFALLACSVVIAPLIEIPFAPVSFDDPLKGLEWNFHSTYLHLISLKFSSVSSETHFQIRLSTQLFLERLILSLKTRVPSIDIYHRIRNPSMDEKVELQYRLRWFSQGSISKVPQSMVDASLELYPIPYSMQKLPCLSEPKKKVGRLGSYAKPEKKNLLSIFELRGFCEGDALIMLLLKRKSEFLYLMSIHPHFHSLLRKTNCLLAGSLMSGKVYVWLREKGGGQKWPCCTSLSSSMGSALSFLGEYANMNLIRYGAFHLTFVGLPSSGACVLEFLCN
ncbi:hypothetical protein L6452_17735 [Arctium lappa]|uniref:Uncharacterized protein n=1 Tax=Arctium lappa TaxID=4217 RepID=A0ACB9C4I7_ARCLA|nr:hypothetical protein L6452_17735 [Arctium lappa]